MSAYVVIQSINYLDPKIIERVRVCLQSADSAIRRL